MPSSIVRELSAKECKQVIAPEMFEFELSSDLVTEGGELDPTRIIMDYQPRASESLRFGTAIRKKGFNIFVTGYQGQGRTDAALSYLREVATKLPPPNDWCYVHNFREPDRPEAISLPAGDGRKLARDMRVFVEDLKREIPRAFEGEDYQQRRQDVADNLTKEREQVVRELQEHAQDKGFLIRQVGAALVTIPLKPNGEPMRDDEFNRLEAKEQKRLESRGEEVKEEVRSFLKRLRNAEKDARSKLEDLDREMALYVVAPHIEELTDKYESNRKLMKYLQDLQEDVVENLADFRQTGDVAQQMGILPGLLPKREPTFLHYQVNVFVDNSEQEGAPVRTEISPTFANMFGRIERRFEMGALVTDLTRLRPGSLHLANGGFLVLDAMDLLSQPFSYDSLKKSLEAGVVRMEDLEGKLGLNTVEALKPEPIPLDLKVILIGNPGIYQIIFEYDPDFRRLFKIRADFDSQADLNETTLKRYSRFIAVVSATEKLLPFDRAGVAKAVEFGVRLADDQKKLSTRFNRVRDLLREADYWAREEQSDRVKASHVRKALDMKNFRENLPQVRVEEMIARGVLLVDTKGGHIGRVNGLSVSSYGDFMLGRPNRVTASVSVGNAGVIDIERRAELGGPIHTKAVLILSGFLAGKYATDFPLSLSASIALEQSYGGIEGDSATVAEVCALLSALSEIPIRQDLAVTGSMNQYGQVQPIGGVNRKIEGFFDVCKATGGLTGSQGVVIPVSNVDNLNLRDELVGSIQEGAFHIWPVSTIEEAAAILLDMDGVEIHSRVKDKLIKFAQIARRFGKGSEKEEENNMEGGKR